MRTLYLARHGKSSWKYPELDDRDRPLKTRGENDAQLIGKLLKDKGVKPGLILSSPAKRASHTAIIFAKELGYAPEAIVQHEGLYFKGIGEIIKTIQQTEDRHDDVMVFGHNPDTLELVNNYADSDFDNVPTSGVACIQFDVESWKGVNLQNGILRWLDYPSLHKK